MPVALKEGEGQDALLHVSDAEAGTLTRKETKVIRKRLRVAVAGFLAVLTILALVRVLLAAHTGMKAAEIALMHLGLGEEPEAEAEALRTRAGRTKMEMDDAEDFSESFGAAVGEMGEDMLEDEEDEERQRQIDALSSKVRSQPTDAPGQKTKKKKGAGVWGDTWMRKEISSAMEDKRQEINDKLPNQIAKLMEGRELPKSDKFELDYIKGPDSLVIDRMEVTSVKNDFKKGKATATIAVRGHMSEPLESGGKFKIKKNSDPYHFKVQTKNFWAVADKLQVDAIYETRSLGKAKVAGVSAGSGRLDGTCYSKKNPEKVDHLCTKFMNIQLNKKKGALYKGFAAKMTKGLQAKLDSKLPSRMRDTV